MKKSIGTYTGRIFYPLDPRREDVCIEDIAHHLSLLARWTGATRDHCNVAHHSVMVARDVERSVLNVKGYKANIKAMCVMMGLMHDSPEAYLNDAASPIKDDIYYLTPRGIESCKVVHRRLLSVIYSALDLPFYGEFSSYVKQSDTRALVTERRDQITVPKVPWVIDSDPLPGVEKFEPMGHKESEEMFLKEYQRLLDVIYA